LEVAVASVSSEKGVPKPQGRARRLGAGLLLALGAAALLAVHWIYPSIRFDLATVVLIVIAAAPLLTVFIDRVRFGDLEVISRKADQALVEVRTARVEQADERAAALEHDRSQDLNIGKALAAVDGGDRTRRGTAEPNPEQALGKTAYEFDDLRQREQHSSLRTARMDDLAARMLGYAQQAEHYDVESALASDSGGTRLTAYAWIFVHPDSRFVDRLLNAVQDREPSAFNQYWAIRALRAAVAATGEPLRPVQVAKMRRILRGLPATSDRRRELEDLMRRVNVENGRADTAS
jgi:hypothetical protein